MWGHSRALLFYFNFTSSSDEDEDEDEENFLSTVSYIGNVWLEILMVATIAKDLDFEKWLGLSEKLFTYEWVCLGYVMLSVTELVLSRPKRDSV